MVGQAEDNSCAHSSARSRDMGNGQNHWSKQLGRPAPQTLLALKARVFSPVILGSALWARCQEKTMMAMPLELLEFTRCGGSLTSEPSRLLPKCHRCSPARSCRATAAGRTTGDAHHLACRTATCRLEGGGKMSRRPYCRSCCSVKEQQQNLPGGTVSPPGFE